MATWTLKTRAPTKQELGYCIYCGSSERLTDEHTIPYSLFGNQVLKKASCHRHSKATAKLEEIVCGSLWEHPREFLKFPTRSARRTGKWVGERTVLTTKTGNNLETVKTFKTRETLPFLCFPYHQAGPRILSGDDSMDWRNGKFQTLIVPLHNRIPKGLRTLRSPSLKIDLVNFMRFMTKIALSEFYRATRIRFFEDDALDFVLGQNLDFTLFCGVSNIAGPRNKLHDVSVKKISIDNPVFKGVAGRVDIRLFAFLKSPTYTFILRPKRSIV